MYQQNDGGNEDRSYLLDALSRAVLYELKEEFKRKKWWIDFGKDDGIVEDCGTINTWSSLVDTLMDLVLSHLDL